MLTHDAYLCMSMALALSAHTFRVHLVFIVLVNVGGQELGSDTSSRYLASAGIPGNYYRCDA